MRLRTRDARATRQALTEAATELFAAHGFAGTNVDRIARRARVNKAMINYHFGGKRGLYVAILLAKMSELAGRLQALLEPARPADDQLQDCIRVFSSVLSARPAIARIMIREVAAGGPNLDADVLPHFLKIFSVVRGIVERGIEQGVFRPASPFLTHLTLVGGLVFFFVTEPMRQRLHRAGQLPAALPSTEEFVRHFQDLMASGLAPERPDSRRSRR